MTISVTSTISRAAGNGSTLTFNFAMKAFAATDLVVRDVTDATGIATLKSYPTDYSVSLSPVGEGGSITFVTAPASGHTVDIRTLIPLVQSEDIRNQGRFLPEIHEGVFDTLERQGQDTRRLVDGAIKQPNYEVPRDMSLPPLASIQGKFLAVDGSGAIIGASGTGNDAALRTDIASTTSGSEGSKLVGYKRTESGAVARAVYSVLNQSVHIADFGGVADDATDTVAPLNAAMAALAAMGGGTLRFSPGTYRFTAVTTYSVRIPVATGTFQPATQNEQVHASFQNYTGIRWVGSGTTFKTLVTNSGEMFIFDGAQNVEIEGITLQTPYAHDAAGVATTVGMNGFGFTSQTRDSYQVRLKNCAANSVYAAIYIFGDPAVAFRVKGVQIDNFRHNNGHYTLACHDNGDNVTGRGMQSINTLREVFLFGCDRVDVEMFSATGVGAFTGLIKAYDRDVTNIRYKLTTSRNITSEAAVHLQSQHNVGVQPVPKRCINIELDINNRGVTGPGSGCAFSYYQDAVLQATAAVNLFTGIKLKGLIEQAPVVNSAQNAAAAAFGTINTDELVLINGSLNSLYQNTGFIDSKQVYGQFTPVMKINGSAAGITFAGTTLGEFWRDGRFVEVLYRIVLTSKGGSVGGVTLDLPIPSAALNVTINPIVHGEGSANMAGLSGPICGFVAIGPGTFLALRVQGAAAIAALTDANLTNTSDFRIWARYPIS